MRMPTVTLSPSDYLASAIKNASVSLTLGVFMGSALTTGIAVGIAAAWIANEKVLRRLKNNALSVLTNARDEALSTREGQALHRALLAVPGAALPIASASPGVAATPSGLSEALRHGEALPRVMPPGGHYLPFTVSGTSVFLSGYTSRRADGSCVIGPVFYKEAPSPNLPEAIEGARSCALGHLAIVEAHLGGVANVKKVLKVTCFVYAVMTPQPFADSPLVANGYSDLLSAALGPAVGMHARSAVAVAGLPGNAMVEVEALLELHDPSLVVPLALPPA